MVPWAGESRKRGYQPSLRREETLVADSNTGSGKLQATATSWSSLRGVAFLAALLIVSAGPALLRSLNRAWDRGPLSAFVGVVTGKYAHRGEGWHLTLKGAPHLPTPDNTMDVNVSIRDYDDAPVGDSVFVVVKPGFFGRLWIVSYRVQTAQDRVQELLERHRVLEQRSRNELPRP